MSAQTQWRSIEAGRTGLDYAGIEALIRLHAVPRAERRERFMQIQTMERAALSAWAEPRK